MLRCWMLCGLLLIVYWMETCDIRAMYINEPDVLRYVLTQGNLCFQMGLSVSIPCQISELMCPDHGQYQWNLLGIGLMALMFELLFIFYYAVSSEKLGDQL